MVEEQSVSKPNTNYHGGRPFATKDDAKHRWRTPYINHFQENSIYPPQRSKDIWRRLDAHKSWMVTGDTKWITYNNIRRKRPWSKIGKFAQTMVKSGLLSRKVLFFVWRDWKGIIILSIKTTGTLGWKVLMHPPYSADLAPSFYHMFLTMEISLDEENRRTQICKWYT